MVFLELVGGEDVVCSSFPSVLSYVERAVTGVLVDMQDSVRSDPDGVELSNLSWRVCTSLVHHEVSFLEDDAGVASAGGGLALTGSCVGKCILNCVVVHAELLDVVVDGGYVRWFPCGRNPVLWCMSELDFER